MILIFSLLLASLISIPLDTIIYPPFMETNECFHEAPGGMIYA